MPKIAENISGKSFGRLIVLYRVNCGRFYRCPTWMCECSCGNTKMVQASALRSGETRSCGCLRSEIKSKHGHSNRTPEYCAWSDMIQRCTNSKVKSYKHYGGRGIKVCRRWLGEEGFQNFFSDMGLRPSPTHSLDRHPNNNGNYKPTNCRWATKQQQLSNTRSNRWIKYKGVKKLFTEWSRDLGIPRGSLGRYLTTMSMSQVVKKFVNTKGI